MGGYLGVVKLGCCVFMIVGALPGRCFVHLRTYFPITSLSDESNMMYVH